MTLRDVEEADLPLFFEQQLDPEASRMAAFPSRGWEAFVEHWHVNVLGNDSVRKQTILCGGKVAGNILSWQQEDTRLVGYWIAREHWGRGIATAALFEFSRHEAARPLYAQVAAENLASIRVLEKSGFRRATHLRTASDGVAEYVYQLDA